MSHGLPDSYRVASAKLKTESLANPHIVLYNSSSFKGVYSTISDWETAYGTLFSN